MKSNLLEVDLRSETHTVRFESPIDSVKIDGQKLNDIHDLALKVDKSSVYIANLTKKISVVAYIATFLAVVVVCMCSIIGGLLVYSGDYTKNYKQGFQNSILKLESLGWKWEDGVWRQIEK